MKKKKATVDLKSLWERTGKVQKTAPTPVPAGPAPPSSLLGCLRFFLQQGLAFQGWHEEIEASLNEGGNLPELLKWLAENMEGADKAVLQNAMNDPLMTSPEMLKGLVSACARETTRCVVRDLGGENFAILACLFGDACQKEQLAVCLRYCNPPSEVFSSWSEKIILKVSRLEMLERYRYTLSHLSLFS